MKVFDRCLAWRRVALTLSCCLCRGGTAEKFSLHGWLSYKGHLIPSRTLATFLLARNPINTGHRSSRAAASTRQTLDLRGGSVENSDIQTAGLGVVTLPDGIDAELKSKDLQAVFVYGTLKRDFGNHHHLASSSPSVFVGVAKTMRQFPLFVDFYRVPYLVDRPGSGHYIRGEVWLVDSNTLSVLDELEQVSQGRYSRQIIDVRVDQWTSLDRRNSSNNNSTMRCWLYALPDGREGTDLGSRALMDEYTAEVHGQFVVPQDRNMSRRRDWGGFD